MSTFILVPGAGGSAWYWHLVVPELQQRGGEAVAVELPAADDRAGLPHYAAAVVRAIGDRDLDEQLRGWLQESHDTVGVQDDLV